MRLKERRRGEKGDGGTVKEGEEGDSLVIFL